MELNAGQEMNESLVKQLTGGERIRARRMREDFWEFDATHKLFLAGNHKPRIKGTDEGIWRRIKTIPFTVQFHNPDRDLPVKLRAELSGILAWAVRGCLEWQEKGLVYPHEIEQATQDYRDEMDDYSDFFKFHCVTGHTFKVSATKLLNSFNDWAARNSLSTLTDKQFREEMSRRGFPKRKSSIVYYHGLALREEAINAPHSLNLITASVG